MKKLEKLGLRPLTYSLISGSVKNTWVRPLKKWSPRFFGDGALNLELFAKRRSELWILVKDDIGVIRKGGQRQVITRRDVAVVNVTGQQPQPHASENRKHRLLQIVDDDGRLAWEDTIFGYRTERMTHTGTLSPVATAMAWSGSVTR